MSGYAVASLQAELLASGQIRVIVDGAKRPLNPNSYHLTNAKGERISIKTVMPHNANDALLSPEKDIDIKRIHFLEIPDLELKTTCSFDAWFKTLYSDIPLGANINGTTTSFAIFAPRATAVNLYLYKEATDKEAYSTYNLIHSNSSHLRSPL